VVVKAFKLILNSGGPLDCPDSLFPPERGEGGVRGFYLGNNGLLTPTLSSFGEEREKKGGDVRMHPSALGCAPGFRIKNCHAWN
jgi:hypothetical protein